MTCVIHERRCTPRFRETVCSWQERKSIRYTTNIIQLDIGTIHHLLYTCKTRRCYKLLAYWIIAAFWARLFPRIISLSYMRRVWEWFTTWKFLEPLLGNRWWVNECGYLTIGAWGVIQKLSGNRVPLITVFSHHGVCTNVSFNRQLPNDSSDRQVAYPKLLCALLVKQ